ncbi:hypothetical protein LMTR3_21970 [Bradyrhizobium sp. LMTR 3]|nr:hypothetical protein LMTR3_21970 [Bradyrhizobium sp. LMTR 3]
MSAPEGSADASLSAVLITHVVDHHGLSTPIDLDAPSIAGPKHNPIADLDVLAVEIGTGLRLTLEGVLPFLSTRLTVPCPTDSLIAPVDRMSPPLVFSGSA